jgi:hypothetical protein
MGGCRCVYVGVTVGIAVRKGDSGADGDGRYGKEGANDARATTTGRWGEE